MKPNLTHHILDFWSGALPPASTTARSTEATRAYNSTSSNRSTNPSRNIQFEPKQAEASTRSLPQQHKNSPINSNQPPSVSSKSSNIEVDEHSFYKPIPAPHRHRLHDNEDASWTSPNVTIQYFSPDEPASYVQTYANRLHPHTNTSLSKTTPPLKSAMKPTSYRPSPSLLAEASSSAVQDAPFRASHTHSSSNDPTYTSHGARLASSNKEDAHALLHAQADLFVTRSATAHKPLAKRQYHTYHPNRTVSKMLVQYAPAFLASTNEGAEMLLQSSRVLAAERINNHLAKHIVAVRGGRKTPFQTRATQRANASKKTADDKQELSKPSGGNGASSSSSRSWRGAGGDHRFRPLVLVEGVKGGVYFINASGKRQYVKQTADNNKHQSSSSHQ